MAKTIAAADLLHAAHPRIPAWHCPREVRPSPRLPPEQRKPSSPVRPGGTSSHEACSMGEGRGQLNMKYPPSSFRILLVATCSSQLLEAGPKFQNSWGRISLNGLESILHTH